MSVASKNNVKKAGVYILGRVAKTYPKNNKGLCSGLKLCKPREWFADVEECADCGRKI